MKYTQTSYGNVEEILYVADNYVSIPVTIDSTTVTAVDGKKILPKGTVVGGVGGSILADSSIKAEKKNTQSVAASVTLDSAAANADLTFTAVNAGAAGNSIRVATLDPGGNSQALAISVSGDTINISLATDGAGAITSTAAEVAAAVNAHLIVGRLITAEAEGDGSGVVDAIAATALENGADGSGLEAVGITLNDCDVTYGDNSVAMLIQGYVKKDKLPEAICSDALSKLSLIKIIDE